jgi:hypothetical protein
VDTDAIKDALEIAAVHAEQQTEPDQEAPAGNGLKLFDRLLRRKKKKRIGHHYSPPSRERELETIYHGQGYPVQAPSRMAPIPSPIKGLGDSMGSPPPQARHLVRLAAPTPFLNRA